MPALGVESAPKRSIFCVLRARFRNSPPIGNIMDGLRLITILLFSMIGGGIAVCALIASILFLMNGACTRLFKQHDHS
jgi:hypothetical protein